MSISNRTYERAFQDRDPSPTVLVVDDNPLDQQRLKTILSRYSESHPLKVLFASSIEEAEKVLSETQVHAVLLDKNLGPDEEDPMQNGIKAIPLLLQIQPHLQILLVTGSKDTQDAVAAIRMGAFDYVTKETPNELLLAHVTRTIEIAKLSIRCTQRERSTESFPLELGGKSKLFSDILGHVQILSESDRPILLLGDSGTGKTEIANWIHHCRKKFLSQKERPFFKINIASLPEDVIASELFGHEKGAFTDAIAPRQGYFELANNGTLFLDEIGEASLDLQAKLLTIIETGEFFRVGGTRQGKTSAKLVFATNRNLEEMVKQGKFRHDLYMRINSFPVHLPNLDQRREDIPDIIRALLPKVSKENNVPAQFDDIPKDFIEYLMNSKIEGNIRGIVHQLDRLLVFSPKDENRRPVFTNWRGIPGLYIKRNTPKIRTSNTPITLSEIMSRPFDMMDPSFPGFKDFISLIKEKIIEDAKQKHDGDYKKIAASLKVHSSYIYPLLKRSGGKEKTLLQIENPESNSTWGVQ